MVRKWFGVLAACALVSSVMLAAVGTAGAGQFPTLTITVTKDVTGTPADDQVYDVTVECTHDDEDVDVDPGNTQSITWDADDEEFDPSDATVVFEIETRVGGTSDDITCTVEETDSADAGSSTIVCTDDSGQADCDDPGTVTIAYAQSGAAELLVTNDYPAPTTTTTAPPTTTTTAPPPVRTQATFTG